MSDGHTTAEEQAISFWREITFERAWCDLAPLTETEARMVGRVTP